MPAQLTGQKVAVCFQAHLAPAPTRRNVKKRLFDEGHTGESLFSNYAKLTKSRATKSLLLMACRSAGHSCLMLPPWTSTTGTDRKSTPSDIIYLCREPGRDPGTRKRERGKKSEGIRQVPIGHGMTSPRLNYSGMPDTSENSTEPEHP